MNGKNGSLVSVAVGLVSVAVHGSAGGRLCRGQSA